MDLRLLKHDKQVQVCFFLSSADFTTNLLPLPLNWHPPSERPLWKPFLRGIPHRYIPRTIRLAKAQQWGTFKWPRLQWKLLEDWNEAWQSKKHLSFPAIFSHFFSAVFFCSLVEYAKTTYTLLPSWLIHYGKHVGIGHCETNKFQYVLENLGLFLLLSKEFLSFPLQYIDPQNNIVQFRMSSYKSIICISVMSWQSPTASTWSLWGTKVVGMHFPTVG